MEEFKTYVFRPNEEATHEKSVRRLRPMLLGILFILISIVLYQLELDFVGFFLILGLIMFIVGRITTSGSRTSVGYRSHRLRLTPGAIFIENNKVEVKDPADIAVRIVGYRGEAIAQTHTIYESHSGNENVLIIRQKDSLTEINFTLDTEVEKENLIAFCEANGYRIL